jgi:hypothetical protein
VVKWSDGALRAEPQQHTLAVALVVDIRMARADVAQEPREHAAARVEIVGDEIERVGRPCGEHPVAEVAESHERRRLLEVRVCRRVFVAPRRDLDDGATEALLE